MTAPIDLTTKPRCTGCRMPATPVGLDARGLCTDCCIDVEFGMPAGTWAEEDIHPDDRAEWELANPGHDATRERVYGADGGR